MLRSVFASLASLLLLSCAVIPSNFSEKHFTGIDNTGNWYYLNITFEDSLITGTFLPDSQGIVQSCSGTVSFNSDLSLILDSTRTLTGVLTNDSIVGAIGNSDDTIILRAVQPENYRSFDKTVTGFTLAAIHGKRTESDMWGDDYSLFVHGDSWKGISYRMQGKSYEGSLQVIPERIQREIEKLSIVVRQDRAVLFRYDSQPVVTITPHGAKYEMRNFPGFSSDSTDALNAIYLSPVEQLLTLPGDSVSALFSDSSSANTLIDFDTQNPERLWLYRPNLKGKSFSIICRSAEAVTKLDFVKVNN